MMHRPMRPLAASHPKRRAGSGSLDVVLILGVVLPIMGFVLPLSRTAIQAAFAWFSRVTSSPFL